MARFNTATITTPLRGDAVNLAGGDAYAVDPRYELAAILLTSFVKDGHYRSADDTMARVQALLSKVPPLFAAKAAVYARTEHGMRSISHVAAAEIARHVKGEQWTKDFFRKVFFRPDDATETLALYQQKYGRRPIPNSLKKGIALALRKFDAYRLAKYKGESRGVKLVDLVNLGHPSPNGAKGGEALGQLVRGELKSTETWESKLSEAGKARDASAEEKLELKGKAWKDLLEGGKLGYLAALRNLRNIAQQAPDAVPLVASLLTDEVQVRKAMVFPFQFLPAMEAIRGERVLLDAVVRALDLSLANVPRFEGKTLIALDDSGSMGTLGDPKSPFTIGALFAAALYKANDATLVMFSDSARYHVLPPSMPVWGLVQEMGRHRTGNGTNFHCVFESATQRFDRVVFLSDMQGWMEGAGFGGFWGARTYGSAAPGQALRDYKARTKADPKVFSFDLQGLGTLMFPERSVYCLAGVSDRIFEVMRTLEEDQQALIRKIEGVQF